MEGLQTMRYHIFALTAILASACTTTPTTAKDQPAEVVKTEASKPAPTPNELDAALPDYYASQWAVTAGWPGEYPAGFSILRDGVVLKAHSRMHPLTPARIDCPVPAYASYQQWNFERTEKDNLNFQVATKIFKITMTKDAGIEYPDDEMGYQSKTLNLKIGDQLSYLRYLGEGFTIVEFQGKEYEINEADLNEVSDINNVNNYGGEDLWLELNCADANKTRAWVLYDEVIRQDGIGPTPIKGYGESYDIFESEVAGIRELMKLSAEHGIN